MQRIPDGHFLGTVAPIPGQDNHIGVLEQRQDRIGEPDRQQPLPIDPGMLGLELEIAGKLNQPCDRQDITVEDVAPTSSSNRRIEAILQPQLREASQCSVAGRHRFPRNCFAGVDVHNH
jgi:hypothetical protein